MNQPGAVLKLHNGTPTVFIDGQPSSYHLVWLPAPEAKSAENFKRVVQAMTKRTGLHLYTFENGTSRFGDSGSAWIPGPGPGREGLFDFSSVENDLRAILNADPEARFHIRLFLEMNPDWDSNKWWSKLHPDECLINNLGWQPEQSMASTVWRAQVNDFLRQLVAHIESVGLADKVVAYQPNVGSSCEWFKYALNLGDRCGDFSPPMQRHFRAWLRTRYAGDESALRRAWCDDNVTFESADVPGHALQFQAKLHTLRDPAVEQQVVDYLWSTSDLSAELAIEFCRTIKTATQNRALAGLFYGYWVGFPLNSDFFRETTEFPCAHGRLQRTGHLGFHRVLQAPEVDFFASPMDYAFRGIGGHCPGMQPVEMVRQHDKLYIQENDDRCWHPTFRDYGATPTAAEFRAVYRRTLVDAITTGQGTWCTSIPYHVQKAARIKGDAIVLGHSAAVKDVDPRECDRFVEEFAACHRAGQWALHVDRASSAEICVLLDDESWYYQTYAKNLELPLVHGQLIRSLPRLGAPADVQVLNDFVEGRLRPYKLYIFLNAFRLDDARRAKLKRQLRRDNRVAVWMYGAGSLNADFSLKHMTDLTGFTFNMTKTPWGPHMHVTDFSHPITRDVPEDLFWGTDLNLSPTFWIQDPKARVLGNVIHAQGRCAEGFGVKEFKTWRSVYVAAPNVPPVVLRGLARYAGVHLYSAASDVQYITRELLAVHTVRGGPRTFSLPRKVGVVYDVFGKRTVARQAASFRVRLKPKSTSLFYVGPQAKLAESLRELTNRGAKR